MWPFDQNNQQMYQQYSQAYDTGNYGGFDQNQAFGHIMQFMQGAPLDFQQRVYQQHFEQMPFEQRAAFAQMAPQYGMNPNDPWSMSQGFMRLGQEQPGLLQQILGHPMLAGAGVVLAGLIAKHVMEHHQRNAYGYDQGGYNQYNQGFNPGYQDQNMRQQIYEDRREEQELRRELRQEEREIDRLEDREHHHHRRDEDYY